MSILYFCNIKQEAYFLTNWLRRLFYEATPGDIRIQFKLVKRE